MIRTRRTTSEVAWGFRLGGASRTGAGNSELRLGLGAGHDQHHLDLDRRAGDRTGIMVLTGSDSDSDAAARTVPASWRGP